MTPPQSILDFIGAQGLGWFLAIVLLIPLSLILILIVAKRYLGVDFEKFLKNQRDEIESELKVVTKLDELCEKLTQMAEAMWGSRDYTDRKFRELESNVGGQHKDMTDRLERIQRDLTIVLALAKKRRSDWTRESDSEVFLKERIA